MSKIWMYQVKLDRIGKRLGSLRDEITRSTGGRGSLAYTEIIESLDAVKKAIDKNVCVKPHRKKVWRGQAKIEKLMEGLE